MAVARDHLVHREGGRGGHLKRKRQRKGANVTDSDMDEVLRKNHSPMGIFGERPLSEEEMLKISPAAVLAQRMMEQEGSVEEILDEFRQDHPEVEIDLDTGQPVDPGPDADYPDRPDHPDFRMLSRIIQQMDYDGEHNEAKNPVEVMVPVGVDAESVVYMATQRARRAEEILSKEGTFYAKAVILWMDAFTAGVKLGREQAITSALDGSIENGSYRSGGVR